MAIMAVYTTKLPHGEAWDRALKVDGARIHEGERGRLIQISMSTHPKAKIQVFPGGKVVTFCHDIDVLHELEAWVNEKLGTPGDPDPLGRPVNVKRMGSGPAYYETREEVIERLTRGPSALSIMSLNEQLSSYPQGHPEKAELLSAAVEAASHFLGSFSIHVFERAVKTESDSGAVRILVKCVPHALDDFASYFLWLLREHRDVAQESLRQANAMDACWLNKDIATDVLETLERRKPNYG